MDHSPTYVELEAMIEKNWLVKSLAEIGRMLNELENEGQITAEEHKALMQLYKAKSKNDI
jgi:hypothetical protein